MSGNRIRPLALGLPEREEEIFAAEMYDAHNDEQFYRPIGGEIEFGE